MSEPAVDAEFQSEDDAQVFVSTGTGGPSFGWVHLGINGQPGEVADAALSPQQARGVARALEYAADQAERIREASDC